MICWRCHSNSINPGRRLPNISDVKTRKRRNVVEIDMIRNNRIDDLVLSRQDHSDFFNVLCWFGFREFSSTRYYVSLVYICEIKNGTVLGNFQALGIMFLSSTYVKYGKTVPFLMKVRLLPFVIFICHEALSECLRIWQHAFEQLILLCTVILWTFEDIWRR